MKTKILQLWQGSARIALFCSFLFSLFSPQSLIAGPPPNITVQPSDLAVSKGGTATFKVVATSTTTMTYQWNLKVLLLNIPILGANSNVLTIPNVSGINVGTYNVSVINANGTKISKDVALNVVNGAPVANNDAYTTPKNTPITNGIVSTSSAGGAAGTLRTENTSLTSLSTTDGTTVNNPASVLSNDADINGDTLTASLLESTPNGQLTFYSNGTFNYTPNLNFVGTDKFTYVANDGSANSATAAVIITVTDNSSPLSPATAETLPATNLLTTSATLNAAINAQGAAASCYFQYGTSTNYGMATSPQVLEAETETIVFFDAITGLTPQTEYHFSIVVAGPGGLTVGNDMTFTTPEFDATTIAISTIGYGSVNPVLNGSLLVIGQNYSITSSPAATGVSFTGWKDADGNLITTNPVLTFTMSSNLNFTANFVDTARPSLSITNVPSGYTVSNSSCTVKGSASDNLALGNVFFSLNKTDWISAPSANAWNNWSASLNLNPGTNSISAYALDVSGNFSATNTVTILYVPVATLTVRTNGSGSISPVLNGATLRLGQSYTLAATPATGFAFTNWQDGNGIILTNKATMTFAMVSNLSLTASFVDVTKPTLTLTTPAATATATTSTSISVTNKFVLVGGKVTDNGPVASVLYKLNSAGWYAAATTNNWTNWSVILDLAPGTNMFYAYAIDTAGNVSTTNTVKFVLTTAPTTLTGLKAILIPASAEIAPFEMAFAAATFSQIANDTNNSSSVGSYTYTKLSPSTATLKLTFTAPPRATNGGARILSLNFTTPGVANYATSNSSLAGTAKFTPVATLAPVSLANQSVIFVGSDGRARSNSHTSSAYVSVDLQTRTTNKGTSFTYATYSPLAALLKETDTNGLTYKVANFVGTNYGTSYSESYSKTGTFNEAGYKFFGLISQRTGGNAPTNLYNRSVAFDSAGSRFWVFAATNTFAQYSPSEDFDSGVGSYAYGRITNNVASLRLNFSAPSDIAGSSTAVKLQFFAPNLAVFTNADGTFGNAILGNVDKFAPASLAGASINTTNHIGTNPNQFTFNGNNTFNITGYLNNAGTYTYSTFSPESGFVQLTFTDGALAGNTGTLQLDYDTTFTGKYRLSVFDNTNTLIGGSRGVFGQP